MKKPRWTSRKFKDGRVWTLWTGRTKLFTIIVPDGQWWYSWSGRTVNYGGRLWDCYFDPVSRGCVVERVSRRQQDTVSC